MWDIITTRYEIRAISKVEKELLLTNVLTAIQFEESLLLAKRVLYPIWLWNIFGAKRCNDLLTARELSVNASTIGLRLDLIHRYIHCHSDSKFTFTSLFVLKIGSQCPNFMCHNKFNWLLLASNTTEICLSTCSLKLLTRCLLQNKSRLVQQITATTVVNVTTSDLQLDARVSLQTWNILKTYIIKRKRSWSPCIEWGLSLSFSQGTPRRAVKDYQRFMPTLKLIFHSVVIR